MQRVTVNRHNPNQFLVLNGYTLKKTHKEEKSSKNEKNVPKGSIDIYTYEESANESDTNYQLTKTSIDLSHFPVMAEFSSNDFLIVQTAKEFLERLDRLYIYKKTKNSYEYRANVQAMGYALHDTTLYSTGRFFELNSRRNDREDVINGGLIPLPENPVINMLVPDSILPVDGFIVCRYDSGFALCDTKQLIDHPTDSKRYYSTIHACLVNHIEDCPVKIRFDNYSTWRGSKEHPLDFSMKIQKNIGPDEKVYCQIVPEIVAGKPVKEQRARVNA